MENNNEEVNECRVCRGEEEPNRKLFAPCKCSGSILHIHSDCLMQWLKHSGKKKCELCNYHFTFSPLYADNAPDKLTFYEVIYNLFRVFIIKWFPFVLKFIFVGFLWLLIVPYITSILYRLWLLRSSSWETHSGFIQRLNPIDLWSDIMSGIIITLFIIFSFLAFISFADFLRFHLVPDNHIIQNNNNNNNNNLNDNIEIRDHNDFRQELRLELQRNRRNNNINNNNNNNNNNNRQWDEDFDQIEFNIAIDELIGFREPISTSIRNISWLISFNAAYLGLFSFIPYTIGSSFISIVLKLIDRYNLDLSIQSIFSNDTNHFTQKIPEIFAESLATSTRRGDCLQFMDIITCILGYSVICVIIIMWRHLLIFIKNHFYQSNNNNNNWLRNILYLVQCLNAIIKVTLLLLLKMVILPIFLGFGVDYVTLHLFSKSVPTNKNELFLSRISFTFYHPIGSFLIHWVMGISFMLFVTVSVLQLREVLHRDILANRIRPQEAHPDLLKTLVEEKYLKHTRRMILSLLIYSFLLVLLIYLPIHIFFKYKIHTFSIGNFKPFSSMNNGILGDLKFSYFIPELQVPLELVVVHMVVLSILERYKDDIGRLQHIWLKKMCYITNLTEYLLPRVSNKNRGDYESNVILLKPPPLHFHPPPAQPINNNNMNAGLVGDRRTVPWPENEFDALENNIVLLPRSKPKYFLLPRLYLLVLITWVSTVTFIFTVLLMPVFTGRFIMKTVNNALHMCHDPVNYAVGFLTLYKLSCMIYYTYKFVKMYKNYIINQVMMKDLLFFFKVVIHWFLVIPLIIATGLHQIIKYNNDYNTNNITKIRFIDTYYFALWLLHMWIFLVYSFNGRSEFRRRFMRRNNNNNNNNNNIHNNNLNNNNNNEPILFNRGVELMAGMNNGHVAPDNFRRRFANPFHNNDPNQGNRVIQQLVVSFFEIEVTFGLNNNNILLIDEPLINLKSFYENVMIRTTVYLIMVLLGPVLSAIFFNTFLIKSNIIVIKQNIEKKYEILFFRGLLFCFFLSSMIFMSNKKLKKGMKIIHDYVRNDRYLIGQQLHDMTR